MLAGVTAKLGVDHTKTLIYGMVLGFSLLMAQFTIVATGQVFGPDMVGYKSYIINQNNLNKCGDTIYHIPTYGCWTRLKDICILAFSHGIIILIGFASLLYIFISGEIGLIAFYYQTFGLTIDFINYLSKDLSPLTGISISISVLMVLNIIFILRLKNSSPSKSLVSQIFTRLRTPDWGEIPWALHVLEFEQLYKIAMDKATFAKVQDIANQSPWNLSPLKEPLVKACFRRDMYSKITTMINPVTADFSKFEDGFFQIYTSSLLLSGQTHDVIFSKFEELDPHDYSSSSLFWFTKGLVDHHYKRWDAAKAAATKCQALMIQQSLEADEADKITFAALLSGSPLPKFPLTPHAPDK